MMYYTYVTLLFCFWLPQFDTADFQQNGKMHTLLKEFQEKVINLPAIEKKISEVLPGDTDPEQLIKLKIFDAASKLPSGLAAGKFFDLGNFDECYDIEYNDTFGKYCLGYLAFTAETEKYYEAFGLNQTKHPTMLPPWEEFTGSLDVLNGLTYYFATCVLSNVPASEIPGLLTYSEDLCSSRASIPAYSNGTLVMIVIFGILLIMILFSTVYDIVLYYLKKAPVHEFFIAFSFLSNGRKLFTPNKGSAQLSCLHGIRAISMMWVILGHEYGFATTGPVYNTLYVNEWLQNPANMYVNGSTVSVDTFFVLAGLVTVYAFFKSIDKGIKFNIFLFYIHRYLRLTPIYIMISLFDLYLLNYLGRGPLWILVKGNLIDVCEKSWWSSFLYITNYVQKGDCLPQAWYLSVDMQLFFLSPIILLILRKSEMVGYYFLSLLSLAGCLVPFMVAYTLRLELRMDNDKRLDYQNLYYGKTYTRFGPYVIGMIFGYLIYKFKKGDLKIKIKPLLVPLAWLLCLAGLVANVYAGYPLNVATEDDLWGNSFFIGFNRNAWAVSVCGAILLCVIGYGGPINDFLSLDIFQFLAKLSYSMYLVHYTVIMYRYGTIQTNVRISDLQIMHFFWGDFIFTLAISLVLTLAFEYPILVLEKYIFGKNTTTKKPTVKKAEV